MYSLGSIKCVPGSFGGKTFNSYYQRGISLKMSSGGGHLGFQILTNVHFGEALDLLQVPLFLNNNPFSKLML
jgi:hypothetical protein